MRGRLLRLTRSLLLGWAVLLAAVYFVDPPLLRLFAKSFDASWFPTAHLALACSALAATGWIVGRASRPASLLSVSIFALTLAFWNAAGTLGIQIPWLLRLAADALHDSRYWGSLLTTAVMQFFLFGSLFAGARLSRQASGKPLSIFPARPS
jgi:hypothetical protein